MRVRCTTNRACSCTGCCSSSRRRSLTRVPYRTRSTCCTASTRAARGRPRTSTAASCASTKSSSTSNNRNKQYPPHYPDQPIHTPAEGKPGAEGGPVQGAEGELQGTPRNSTRSNGQQQAGTVQEGEETGEDQHHQNIVGGKTFPAFQKAEIAGDKAEGGGVQTGQDHLPGDQETQGPEELGEGNAPSLTWHHHEPTPAGVHAPPRKPNGGEAQQEQGHSQQIQVSVGGCRLSLKRAE